MSQISIIALSSHRYIEKNVKCHSMYKRYNGELPAYLVNRPRFFVSHCKDKIGHARDYGKAGIKLTGTDGLFKVKSDTNDNKWYNVQLKEPSCECMSWQRTRLPCKHMFAIFMHHPQWNWDSLPANYRESAFINLDYDLLEGNLLNQSSSSTDSTSPSSTSECTSNIDDGDDHLSASGPDEPPSKRHKACSSDSAQVPPNQKEHSVGSEAKVCRDLLHQIRELTFVLKDAAVFKQLHNQLKSLLQEVAKHKPTEDGLTLEGKQDKDYKRNVNVSATQVHASIEKRCKASLRRRPKRPKHTGRVGKKAAQDRKTINVHVPVTPTKPKSSVQTPLHNFFSTQQPMSNPAPSNTVPSKQLTPQLHVQRTLHQTQPPSTQVKHLKIKTTSQ